MRRRAHQAIGKPVVLPLQHVEGLPEAQIPQNVHRQIPKPVTHTPRRRPPLAIRPQPTPDLVTERPDVRQYVPLHLLYGAVTKGVRHDSSLPGVQVLVSTVVRVGRGVHKGVVEGGLCYVGPEAIDVLERGGGVEGEGAGADADDFACVATSTLCVSLL